MQTFINFFFSQNNYELFIKVYKYRSIFLELENSKYNKKKISDIFYEFIKNKTKKNRNWEQ